MKLCKTCEEGYKKNTLKNKNSWSSLCDDCFKVIRNPGFIIPTEEKTEYKLSEAIAYLEEHPDAVFVSENESRNNLKIFINGGGIIFYNGFKVCKDSIRIAQGRIWKLKHWKEVKWQEALECWSRCKIIKSEYNGNNYVYDPKVGKGLIDQNGEPLYTSDIRKAKFYIKS